MELEKYMKENNVDMMAVSEVEITKTSFHYDQLYHIDGYKLIFPMSWTTKGKARLICYYKDSLDPFIKIRSDLAPPYQPVIWLEVGTSPSFLVAFVYREWTSIMADKTLSGQQMRFNEFLSKASTVTHKEVVIMGDVNINGLKLDRDGTLEASLLDHNLTNNKPNADNVEITKMSNSDHDIISMTRKSRRPSEEVQVTVRSFKNFQEDSFLEDLKTENWMPVDTAASVDEAVDLFNAAVHRCLVRHAPKITFKPRTRSNPMLSPTTISTIRERDMAYNRAKKTKDPLDVDIFRRLRNKVVGLIKRDSNAATNLACATPRGTWTALNKLTRDNKARHGPPTKLKIGDEMITDKQKMADSLNDFFIAKVEKLRDKIRNKEQPYDPVLYLKRLLPPNMPALDLKSVTASEVAEVLSIARNTNRKCNHKSFKKLLVPYLRANPSVA